MSWFFLHVQFLVLFSTIFFLNVLFTWVASNFDARWVRFWLNTSNLVPQISKRPLPLLGYEVIILTMWEMRFSFLGNLWKFTHNLATWNLTIRFEIGEDRA